ncbi:hypothetical protein [Bosea minatitlanensis]|uniref:Uncharacterized protein n=1 Tax=Bosea minatitlanensis TaxID=128782 RepID=A0ABW0F247_9HYPH|nr:hypothetical protein [Bosea minatitlanensis]MCT4492686.1 hypothetical protein [Bosea minatitlanensis]
MSGVDIAGLVESLRSLADCDARAGEPLGKCMRRAADVIERGREHIEYIEAQWLAKDAALKSATRQRDEALAAIKASEERGAAKDAALRKVKHWAESRCPCRHEEPNPCPLCGASVENLEACKSAENTMPRDVLQAIRSALADATNNPPSDPGTEQREAGV